MHLRKSDFRVREMQTNANGPNWFILQYMGTVLAVIYAVDTIVAYKYYRDSGDWL